MRLVRLDWTAAWFGGLWWFVSRTRAIGKAGQWSPIALMTGLAVLQAIDWHTQPPTQVIDPAPASTGALGLLAYAIATLLAWWVARTRERV